MSEVEKVNVKQVVTKIIEKSLEVQFPAAAAGVERLRRVHPKKSPREMISYLNKIYIGSVTVTGAGAGAAAIIPNGAGQISVAILDLGTFLEASVFYTLAIAEIHGVHVEDLERRKALVMFALLGNSSAAAVVDTLVDRSAPYWGKKLVQVIPIDVIRRINKIMGPGFIAKWSSKQGALILGKQVPLFIGMGVGAAGNALFARAIVSSTKKLLGPAPAKWPAAKAPSKPAAKTTPKPKPKAKPAS